MHGLGIVISYRNPHSLLNVQVPPSALGMQLSVNFSGIQHKVSSLQSELSVVMESNGNLAISGRSGRTRPQLLMERLHDAGWRCFSKCKSLKVENNHCVYAGDALGVGFAHLINCERCYVEIKKTSSRLRNSTAVVKASSDDLKEKCQCVVALGTANVPEPALRHIGLPTPLYSFSVLSCFHFKRTK